MSQDGGILKNSIPLRPAGEELNNFDGSNYAQKAEMIQKEAEDRVGLDDILEAGTLIRKFFTQDLPKISATTYKTVKTTLTPDFIKRMNRKKIHIKYVQEKEEKLDFLHDDAEDVMAQEKKFAKAERERSKLIAEMLKYKQQVKDEEKEVIDAAKAEIAEVEFREFHKRREEQIREKEEKRAKTAQAARERQEKEEQDLRDWRVNFFTEQAEIYGKEAANLSPAKVRREKNEEALNRIKSEWVDREQARIRMQVELAPNQPGNDLPDSVKDKVLYGFERKAFKHHGIDTSGEEKDPNEHPSTRMMDLTIEEVEDEEKEDSHHDVHLFDHRQANIAYEKSVIQQYDVQSALIQQQNLYQALEMDIQEMKESISRMMDMKEILEREQKQITEEIIGIEIQQSGPPRRLAMSHEIPAMDLWKQRAAQTKKNLTDLSYAIDKSRKKREAMVQQSLLIAKSLASLKEKDRESQHLKDSFNDGMGNLPMVIGRSISTVPGMNIMANAGEFTQAIIHKSKLINMKSDGDQALLLHKEGKKLDQEMWMTRLQETNAKVDLESMISRIAAIGEKLQHSKIDTMKLNIIDALKGFLASGIKLHAVRKKVVGIIPWFKHHDYTHSVNIIRYITNNAMGALVFDDENEDLEEVEDEATVEEGEEEKSRAMSPNSRQRQQEKRDYSYGVTLGPANHGVCCGSLLLPKDTLWIISVTITKQGNGTDYDNPFSQDSVTVEFGPTLTAVQTVGVYYNRINPQTGTVLYDVKYIFRGNMIAYKFTFHSLSNETKRHLAICTGIYEEFEIPDLETVSDPKNMKKTRVLSSYVKTIRMEEKKGKLRETKLLEELIDVENSTSPYWDSQTLNFTLQRYAKEYFLRILKAEILLQQQITMKQREKEQQRAGSLNLLSSTAAASSEMVNEGETKQLKLKESAKRYIMKKRAAQQSLIHQAELLIGKRLVLWDAQELKWRNLLVNDVIINWIENGLVAQIIHKIQEYNDINEPLGKEKEINLNKFKYFLSPIQEFDEQLLAKLKEKLKWQQEIATLEAQSHQEQKDCDIAYEKYVKRSIRYYKNMKQQIIDRFENTVQEQAMEAVKKSIAKQRIQEDYYPEVMLDMRKGIIEIDLKKESKGNVRKLARQIAKERYMQQWITNRREELMQKLQEKEQEMQIIIQQKLQESIQQKQRIQQSYQHSIEQIKQFLRRQYQHHKNRLLEQVKFPKDVFQKVLPISYHCEHLRTKAWGDLYSKGVKCLHCGKELSELHEEESQILGYGSGGNRELYEKYRLHYEIEANYRPSNNYELVLLEKERLRLEKERRELEMNEQYFYDFQDLRVIYEFDRRHAREIKQAGIFRQGLQWTEEEIQLYEQTKLIKEEIRLRNEGLPESLIEDYDPLGEIQNPPPTFRAIEERHYAQYKDLLYYIGRLHNFQKKIEEFKKHRFDLLQEKKMYAMILEGLHKESYQTETSLIELETDLDRTSQLLYIYSKMEKLWLQANMITNQAKKQQQKIEMNQCYYPHEMKMAKEAFNLVHYEMKNLLKTKIVTERQIDTLRKEQLYTQEVGEKQERLYQENHRRLMIMRLCMPGNMVYTRLFGLVYIVSYRSSDDMVLVSLPFGKPAAKAYVYYQEIYEVAYQQQQNEIVLMGREDERMQTFVRQEKIMIRKELYLMSKEEENIRKIFEFWDLNQQEGKIKQQAINQVVSMAYEITQSQRYQVLQRPAVEKRIETMKNDRLRRRKEYIGPKNNRPKPMSLYESYQQRKTIMNELKQTFITNLANETDQTTMLQLYEQRREWLLNYLFLSMIDRVVKEMIYEIAEEGIHEGKEAKLATEKKTGIFFPQPSYMSYGTYNLLSTLWQNQKNQLKQEILVNESAVQKLILSLQAKVSLPKNPASLSNEAKERRLWLLKNPNYNNNKKLAKAYWDVTRKAQQYQANQAAAAGGGSNTEAAGDPTASTISTSGGENKSSKKGSDSKEEEEVVIDGHVVQKKTVSKYEKKKARKLLQRLKQLELDRQQRLCYEMFQEELRCKAFYTWEMKENLRERRLMKEEEKLSLTIRKEEEKLKKAIAERMLLIQKQRQQGLLSGEDQDLLSLDDIKLSDLNLSSELLAKRDLSLTYEKRRKELKDLTLERRRRTEDQRLMIIEDELSYQLREIDKIERQRKAFEQEFGKDDEEEVGGEGSDSKKVKRETDDLADLIAQFASSTPDSGPLPFTAAQSEKLIQSIRMNDRILSTKLLPIPDWLERSLPKRFSELTILERNYYIKRRVTVEEKSRKIQKALAREEKRLLRLEKKSYKEWEMKYRILEQMTRKSELLVMETKEESLIATKKLLTVEENIHKIDIFCREVGEKELQLKTKYQKLLEAYRNGQEEYQEACDWYQLCLRRNKNRDKLKRRVVANCQFIDSDSINGFYQRFETHRLRERVYLTYFQTIVQSIVNRAEMVATERKLLLLQHGLSENKNYLLNREKGMNAVKRELKCAEYLRMRRSLLNQTFFPKNRNQLLSNALKGWIRFYCWNRGQKNAYQLKYELVKRQLDIDRQFRKQLALRNQYDFNSVGNNPSSTSPPPPPTLMSRVRERPVQCKHCFNFYIASQNHSLSCAYHPETYQLQCPESCPQPGLTALCSVHRKKRWGCCRLTDQNAIGCARRYHTPPDSDPVYDYIMEKINERDAQELERLEEEITIARQENYPEKVKNLQKSQLISIEKNLEEAREIAGRYKNLKFV